ncbi:MAG TPA: hypothetical protein PLP34_11215, partial [Chitinophagaceae bacterium]|nr:hypothetical protein [Chitinophagaceae bacterium]
FFLQKNVYKAYGSFFPSSAVMSGRINLFRETQQEWIDFFGGENEVDRAYVVGNSAAVISYLIDKFDFPAHYQIDVKSDPNGSKKVYKRFVKNFSLSRSGYKHLEVNFTDEDHDLAYRVVNEAMNRTEDLLRELYRNINLQLALSLEKRTDSISTQLNLYTDSLVHMRVRYGIYDLLSPGRSNLIQASAKGSGEQYASGLEQIQNIEEIKDRLTIDRAKYISLANEFKTAGFKGFPMIHVVQWATPNGPKAGPYRILGVGMAFVLSLVFAILMAMVVEFIRNHREDIFSDTE